jgi:hypothetical protein
LSFDYITNIVILIECTIKKVIYFRVVINN